MTSSFRMLAHSSSSGGGSAAHELQSMERIASNDLESGVAVPSQAAKHPTDDLIQIPHRNPWLMRTHLNFPIIPFPFSRKSNREKVESPSQISLNNFSNTLGQTSPPIRTRVWHDEHGDSHDTKDCDDDADQRSIASAQGVVVETHLVRESHPTDGQR